MRLRKNKFGEYCFYNSNGKFEGYYESHRYFKSYGVNGKDDGYFEYRNLKRFWI